MLSYQLCKDHCFNTTSWGSTSACTTTGVKDVEMGRHRRDLFPCRTQGYDSEGMMCNGEKLNMYVMKEVEAGGKITGATKAYV